MLTRKERCELAIQKGYKYNRNNGKITGPYGKELISKYKGFIQIQLTFKNKRYNIYGHQFAWYYIYKKYVEQINHINGDTTNNKISNLRRIINPQF